MGNGERYFRHVTAKVIQFYLEFEDGIIPGGSFETFDPRLIDYRIDVERVMATELDKRDIAVLLSVHRDGLTHADACRLAGLPNIGRPDWYVAALEIRLGRNLDKKKMLDLMSYFRP